MHDSSPWARLRHAIESEHPVAATAAVRDLLATEGFPADAVAYIGPAFAHAYLTEDASLPACRVAAHALAAHLQRRTGLSDFDVAWGLMLVAADAASPPLDAEHVLTLASLQRHAGQDEAATKLARGAQQRARIGGHAQVFGAASWLLAELAHDDGDADLARDLVRHAVRWMEDMGDHTEAAAFLDMVRNEHRTWTQA